MRGEVIMMMIRGGKLFFNNGHDDYDDDEDLEVGRMQVRSMLILTKSR